MQIPAPYFCLGSLWGGSAGVDGGNETKCGSGTKWVGIERKELRLLRVLRKTATKEAMRNCYVIEVKASLISVKNFLDN